MGNSKQGSTPGSAPSPWPWFHKCQMMGRQSQVLRNEQAGGGGALPAAWAHELWCRVLVAPETAGGRQEWASSRNQSLRTFTRFPVII